MVKNIIKNQMLLLEHTNHQFIYTKIKKIKI